MDFTIVEINPEERSVAVIYHAGVDRPNNLFLPAQAFESEAALLAALSDHARHYDLPPKQAPAGLTGRRRDHRPDTVQAGC